MSDQSPKCHATDPVLPVCKPLSNASRAVADHHVRFYSEYPSLARELPHCNPRNGANLVTLKVNCSDCGSLIPLEEIHGVINDYANCTEIRYVGACPECHCVMPNVLRVDGEEMRFIQDGKWCVSTSRPWWHCLWPWPVDREW